MTEPSANPFQAGTAMLASLGIELNQQAAPEPEAEEFDPIPVVQETTVLLDPPDFSVPRAVLVRMVEQCMLVVPARDFVPALKNLVLDVSDGRLSVTGSDSTSTVICHTAAVRVTRPGRVLIGAAKFAAVVRRTAGPEIRLRAEDQLLHIESGKTFRSLRVASVQDYVQLAELEDLSWHTVDRHAFARAVAASRYAAGSDENDPARMQLDICAGTITATDKFSFAQVSGVLPADLTCEMSVAAADLLVKMLDRNDASEFRLATSRFHMVAEIGPVESPDRMVVAHITESFPVDARNAVLTPLAENRDLLTVNADELLEALSRAVPTSDEETLAVALKCTADSVTVATRNRYGDLSSEQVSASFVRLGSDKPSSDRQILLNHKRLSEAVRAACEARSSDDGVEPPANVRLLLGVDRSRARPAFVVVQDGLPEGVSGSGSVRAVLSQVRSDWMS